MTGQSPGLKVFVSIALVAMTFAGLVSCGGGPGMPRLPSQGAPDQAAPDQAAPDLVVESPSVSNSDPAIGAMITLSATARNGGATASAGTTLRFYRSMDATITTTDTEVEIQPVAALSPSDSSAHSISLEAPATAGTYYYGACVDAVAGESDIANNCSTSVQVDVSEMQSEDSQLPVQRRPDLVVFSVTSGTFVGGPPGSSFTLRGRIRNDGDVESAATTLRFYSSRNQTITTTDTSVGAVAVGALAASGGTTISEPFSLTAPATAGTYYYGACVEAVTGESDTTNNCSGVLTITVDGPPPDLVVLGPNVSEPREDRTFWLIATVHNQGRGGSAATTVRYKRSTDATITTSDTSVGTDEVNTLVPSGGYAATIKLTAPSTAGTYYYGACVDAVPRESDTTNNCSSTSARLDVN